MIRKMVPAAPLICNDISEDESQSLAYPVNRDDAASVSNERHDCREIPTLGSRFGGVSRP